MSRTLFRNLVGAVLALSIAGCAPSSRKSSPQPSPQAIAPALPAAQQAQAHSSASAPASAPSPQQQRIQALIANVEKTYAAGQADYRKGNLPDAKAQFDRAVDLMLASGIDIKSNPQLQDEFDRIIDSVNALEMEALKQGNGFAPTTEPSPGDVASDVTFAVDPNLVAKARADLATTKSDLPLVINDYVAAFINFFAYTQRGHNTLLHSFERAGRYKTMIQRVMSEEGVPQDLIYLAVAESGFQPRAVNRSSGAGGMWQFMPYGDYGLTRDRYVDERFDPEKSTRAYARYMKFLYDQLGDWYLAMAAYDHGAGNIQRAVQRTGYADFWELYKRHELPRETENYVPEIIAAIIIANHPRQYGFDEVTLDPPVLTDTVTINYSIDLRLVSDLVDAPVDELIALNPSLLRYTTPPDTSFDLHLPAGAAALFQQRVAVIPEDKRDAWRYHRVTPDDTLASVASSFHVSVAELAAANGMSQNESLSDVEALAVPTRPAVESASRGMLYTARRGDTLISIADRFGVSLAQLRRWNHLSGIRVPPGRRLRVAEPARIVRTRHSRHRSSHTAQALHGDPPPSSARAAHRRKSAHSASASTAKSSSTHHRKSTTHHHAASSSSSAGK
jgi:membrane-bound lytic murein transglycosylase D